MSRSKIHSDRAPAAVGPYSQGIRVGNLLFVSGQLPLDPDTGKIVSGGASAQAERSLRNLAAVAEAAGAALADAVKVSVFLTDMADFPAVNEVYGRWFTEPFPGRSTVAVAELPLGAAVEIDAVIAVASP